MTETREAPFTLLLAIAYDGGGWAGMAVQDNAPSVGGALLEAIRSLDADVSRIRVASRTDAGVHARDQRVAFDTRLDIPMRGWVLGLCQQLPSSIVVLRAARVPHGFKPRYETRYKRYRYLVLCHRLGSPFLSGRAWRVHDLEPDAATLATMRSELALALGTHDFSALSSAHDGRRNTTRTMHELDVRLVGEMSALAPEMSGRLIAIDVTGDGFLHHMVRILVGTVVDVARRRLAPGALARALSSGDRRQAGVTAPADGLYLEHIELTPVLELDAWPR